MFVCTSGDRLSPGGAVPQVSEAPDVRVAEDRKSKTQSSEGCLKATRETKPAAKTPNADKHMKNKHKKANSDFSGTPSLSHQVSKALKSPCWGGQEAGGQPHAAAGGEPRCDRLEDG